MLKRLTVWITTNCGKFLEMGVPDRFTCLLKNLYASQQATVRTGHGTMDWFKIEKGVQGGWVLSPYLFNSYIQSVSCEILTWMNHRLESRLLGEISTAVSSAFTELMVLWKSYTGIQGCMVVM